MELRLFFVLVFSCFLIPAEFNEFASLISHKRVEAFRKQLESACNDNRNCTILAIFASELCSQPSTSPFCQTDCKFLIERLSKVATQLEPLDEVVTELPQDCSYKETPHHDHAPENCQDGQDGCKRDSNYKVELNLRVAPDGKMYIDDSNIKIGDDADILIGNATKTENKVAEPIASEAEVPDAHAEQHEKPKCVLSETETLQAGEVSTAPCADVYGENFAGDAIQFCSSTEVLLQSSALCIEPSYAPFQFTPRARAPMRTEPLRGVGDLTKYKDDIETASKVLGTVKKVLKNKKLQEFLPIAKKIAGFLGPVGVAFQVVLFFIPDGPDKKHEAIISSLKTLEDNTELIIQKIDKLDVVIRKEIQDSKLDDIVVKLQKLESSFKRYATNPTAGMKTDVFSSCKLVSGDMIVEYYLNLFNSKSLMRIAELYDFHRDEFMEQLGNVAITNSLRGISAALKCFAMEAAVTADDIQHLANDLQPKLVKITEKIQQTYDKVIPEYAVNKQLETDIKNKIRNVGGSNQDLAYALRKHFEKSYDFYTFGVIVQNEAAEYKWRGLMSTCYACVGANVPGAIYVKNFSGRNVMVIYSNKERCISLPSLHYVDSIVVEYERPRLFRSMRDAQDMSYAIWDRYGKNNKNNNKVFNAFLLAKYLEIGHTSQAPSNAIGIWFSQSYYKFMYVC